jgi:hypothetical protein
MSLFKLSLLKTLASKIIAPVIEIKPLIIETANNLICKLVDLKTSILNPHPTAPTEPVKPETDELTSVPQNTEEAVVTYDSTGDGEQDTFVRFNANEIEDRDDLDSYIAFADERLAQQGIEADLKKVIFEDADGNVIKVLYRTDDGWSDTDPDTVDSTSTDEGEDLMTDLFDPANDNEAPDADEDDESEAA